MKTSESNKKKTFTEEIKGTASEIISQVRKIIREGNARRVMIMDKKGKILFQSQMTVGVGGAVVVAAIAPVVSAISMFLLFMSEVKIVVERYPDEETDGDEYEVEADAEVIEVEDEED
ncbi:MAG: DUF4342 domain-containing protein [Balneolaceae bacterium]|nr:DUF4342 domain-containing protein [Balneolaceae bacterium]